MEEPKKNRFAVDGRGIELIVQQLRSRASKGDQEAERALSKLGEALEACSKLCGGELKEGEYLAVNEGARILLEAAQGKSKYSRKFLLLVAEQTVRDCKGLGLDPPDISFLKEENE